MNRILAATRNSWNGLVHVCRNETAFRQEVALLIAALPVGFWLSDSVLTFVLLIGPLLLLLIVELLNTGLEAIGDGLSQDYMDEIKIAKDCGSAAVAITMVFAALVWAAVIVQKIGFLS
ncbi:MAG: diacylglycerol kinase [Pseudomonadota bacterium]